jgi:hypothetical protein
MNSVDIVNNFWSEVWQPPYNVDAIDRLVVDDFVLTTGGQDIGPRAEYKNWVIDFLSKITGVQLDPIESFQNEDGSRVASRWVLTGWNNGILETPPKQEPIRLTGTAVWAVGQDGILVHNWVERSAWELYQGLVRDLDLAA